jgi:hypothetical protein
MNNLPMWLRATVAEREFEQHVAKCADCQSGLVPGGCKAERRLYDVVARERNGY